jgi:hypothetical protein
MSTSTETTHSPAAPPKVEWVVWFRGNSRSRWRPVDVARSEKEAIGLITCSSGRGTGNYWWGLKGTDPNR